MSFISPEGAVPLPSKRSLCKKLGIGSVSFQKYRRELESTGWLETRLCHEKGRIQGNDYTLLVPEK